MLKNQNNKNKVYLKAIVYKDLKALYKIYCEPEINKWFGGKISFEQYKKNFRKFKKKMKNGESVHLAVVLENKEQPIGEVNLYSINREYKSAEFLIIISKKFWRQGYGLEASHKIIEHAFKKMKLRRLTSEINSKNIASIKLCKKLGFTIEGIKKEAIKFEGKWCDEVILGILNK